MIHIGCYTKILPIEKFPEIILTVEFCVFIRITKLSTKYKIMTSILLFSNILEYLFYIVYSFEMLI